MAAPVTVDLCKHDYQPPDQADAHADNAAAVQPSPQEEYNFVKRPSEDYFCPVTLDLLLDPHQTACCGHHLSHEAAARLQREGKPCPVCKQPNLTTVVDKFFKRKVKELRVRCAHKAGGCEWVGEVGSRDRHHETCPKHPWECEYCPEKGLYEIREGHMPNCTHRPTPCPNKCEVGYVTWYKLDEHVAMCPLQQVECEFSHAGCKVVDQRREMARHMEEGTQQHLLAATLLNLSLTRQMRADMQGKMEEMRVEMQGKMEELEGKVEQLQEKMADMQKIVEEKSGDVDGKLSRLGREMTDLLTKQGTFDFILTDIGLNKSIDWKSLPFDAPGLFNCELQLHMRKKRFSTCLYVRLKLLMEEDEDSEDESVEDGESKEASDEEEAGVKDEGDKEDENNDDDIPWPITVKGCLTLLNQLGNHGHHSENFSCEVSKDDADYTFVTIMDASTFTYGPKQQVQYLKDKRLCFRLHVVLTSS